MQEMQEMQDFVMRVMIDLHQIMKREIAVCKIHLDLLGSLHISILNIIGNFIYQFKTLREIISIAMRMQNDIIIQVSHVHFCSPP